jgi:hypothetical protein
MNPTNEPKPERRALDISFPPINSPITAPRKGPRMMPHGRKNNPRILPAMHPRLPAEVPPLYLLPKRGVI